jgi:hypothetical protein
MEDDGTTFDQRSTPLMREPWDRPLDRVERRPHLVLGVLSLGLRALHVDPLPVTSRIRLHGVEPRRAEGSIRLLPKGK